MKVIDIILNDDKEATAPPSLSRQGNVRGALGPGAFPVSLRGQCDHDDTTTNNGDSSSLSEDDEEQPPSTDTYLAEATAVTDGNGSLVEVQRIAHITEVYEGKIVMPNEEVDDKKAKAHRPICSRKTFLLVAIAVVITGAVVGFSTYALVQHFDSLPTPWNKRTELSQEDMLNNDPPDHDGNDGKKGSGHDDFNYADCKNGCDDAEEQDSSENTLPPDYGP